jgi:AcrR family transcriptional regulator
VSATTSQARSNYRSPLRARQAAQTRAAVLDAATGLFIKQGWKATTIAAVAAGAGTAVETVYSGFRSKSELLTSAIDAALVGDDRPLRLSERREFADLGSGTATERLARAAHLITTVHARTVLLLRALQEAAASDSGAAARWQEYELDRRATILSGLSLMLGRRPRSSLVDSLWAIASPELFGKLVIDRGWTPRRYERWLLEVAEPLIDGAAR